MTQSKTRAAVPPPKKRQGFLPEQREVKAADNMRGEKIVGMTFNMEESWHREFKVTSTMDGFPSMKDLLIECFEAYKREKAAKK